MPCKLPVITQVDFPACNTDHELIYGSLSMPNYDREYYYGDYSFIYFSSCGARELPNSNPQYSCFALEHLSRFLWVSMVSLRFVKTITLFNIHTFSTSQLCPEPLLRNGSIKGVFNSLSGWPITTYRSIVILSSLSKALRSWCADSLSV